MKVRAMRDHPAEHSVLGIKDEPWTNLSSPHSWGTVCDCGLPGPSEWFVSCDVGLGH